MNIRSLIGMPLGYAISVLQEKNLTYHVEQTVSRSHFFHCDEQAVYVIRAVEKDGVVQLLVNYSLEKSESVEKALQMEKMDD